MNWSKALKYILRLNEISNRILGHSLQDYRQDIKELWNYFDIHFANEELNISASIPNINLEHRLDDMTDEDIVFFGNFLNGYIKDNFIELKYNEYAVYNNDIFDIRKQFFIYDELLRAFRGIVIDLKNKEIVCSPFDKFANIGEYGWAENDIEIIKEEIKHASLVEISEKLDGSLQSARFYNGKIFLSGSGTFDVDISDQIKTSNEWIANQPNYVKMLKEHPDDTHIFEWIHYNDPHIVKYNKEDYGLHLIGVRNSKTGYQYTYKETLIRANEYNVMHTKMYSEDFNTIFKNKGKFKSDELEGYVLNIDGHRVKLKCDQYLELARTIGGQSTSLKTIALAYHNDTLDDILSIVPQSKRECIIELVKKIAKYEETEENKIEGYYKNSPKDADIKTFAIWVNKNIPKKYRGYLINKYLNKPCNVLVDELYHKDGTFSTYHIKINYEEIKEIDIENIQEYEKG